MKRLSIALLLIVCLFIGGCGVSKNVTIPYTNNNSSVNYKIRSSVAPQETIEMMTNQIREALDKENRFSKSSDIMVNIDIVTYRMRPDVARLTVGIMAGCDNMISHVTIFNNKTMVGKAVFESHVCEAWGVQSQVIRAHTSEIIKYITGK